VHVCTYIRLHAYVFTYLCMINLGWKRKLKVIKHEAIKQKWRDQIRYALEDESVWKLGSYGFSKAASLAFPVLKCNPVGISLIQSSAPCMRWRDIWLSAPAVNATQPSEMQPHTSGTTFDPHFQAKNGAIVASIRPSWCSSLLRCDLASLPSLSSLLPSFPLPSRKKCKMHTWIRKKNHAGMWNGTTFDRRFQG
jgi:hypothetical protein